MFIGLILNISLNLALIPSMGILGAAVGTMVATLT
jgi:O-antigen/teichoic acid export membrane protein